MNHTLIKLLLMYYSVTYQMTHRHVPATRTMRYLPIGIYDSPCCLIQCLFAQIRAYVYDVFARMWAKIY